MRVGQIATPETLQVVKTPGFVSEQVHDDIAGVDQDPVGLAATFSDVADHSLALQPLEQMLGHRFQMSPGATRSDHHGIGHAGLADEIDDDGVDRFVVTKRCFDEMLEIVVRRFGSRLGTYDDDPPFIRLAQQSHCLARD